MAEILAGYRHLSPVKQEVLALCDWGGLSYSEAAAAMAVPAGTLRSRPSRARGHLRHLVATTRPGQGGDPTPSPCPTTAVEADR